MAFILFFRNFSHFSAFYFSAPSIKIKLNYTLTKEAEHIKLLQQGNRRAFEALYQLYSNALLTKILSMTKLPDIADELVQDIFLKVWEKHKAIKDDLSFKGWLYKIAENTVFDYYRKLARDKKMQEYLLQTFAELYNHTEDYILNKERTALLEKALSKLPEQRKIIFKLCRLEEKSYQEVANLLQISPSTVSNQLVKATKTIKDYIFFNSREFLLFMIAFYLRK
ncbi:RNA polymerase sigma factor [Pedobacter sp. AW1-32]|uniref:RNA polymerase sigma factor n=1 Tax=Pedobacter sp. AW1-32 TaxID=3383026 RepID=UPI003FF0D49B